MTAVLGSPAHDQAGTVPANGIGPEEIARLRSSQERVNHSARARSSPISRAREKSNTNQPPAARATTARHVLVSHTSKGNGWMPLIARFVRKLTFIRP